MRTLLTVYCLIEYQSRSSYYLVVLMQNLKQVKPSSISTDKLNTLLHLHLLPIKQVVYLWTYPPPCGDDGRSYLGAGFALRCFQRLSLEDVATSDAPGGTTGTPEVFPSWSSRTKESSPQISMRPRRIETDLSHDGLNPARVPL